MHTARDCHPERRPQVEVEGSPPLAAAQRSTVKQYYVYILSNRYRTVLYTGVTNNIHRRMEEHQSRRGSQFTSRYRTRILLHLETFNDIKQAIAREKQIKAWRRDKKLALIRTGNPELEDLAG
ncbi:MAG: hypothetical protein RhofKO_43090 [Rhodothermales bacterium]